MKTNEIKATINAINGKERKSEPKGLSRDGGKVLEVIKTLDDKAVMVYDFKEGHKTSPTITNNASGEYEFRGGKALRYEVYVKRNRITAFIGNVSPLARLCVDNPHLQKPCGRFSKSFEVMLFYNTVDEFIKDIERAYKSEEKPKTKASTNKRKATKKAVNKAV